MAKRGKPFQKGQTGNPNGRPVLSPEVKALRKITVEALEEIGDLILMGDRPKLQAIASSLTEPAIRVIYAKAAVNAMVKGDVASLELILNRVVGKVKEKVEHSGKITLEDLVAGYDAGTKKD